MAGKNEAVVVLCRCGIVQKTFGITAEKVGPDSWKFVWAFPMKETGVNRKGHDKTEIKGRLLASAEYPGCPYCHNKNIVVCDCGRIGCDNGRANYYKFPWCGKEHKFLEDYKGKGIIAGEDA